MQQKEILEKIEEMFNDAKSSGFVTHLLHAYLPLNKVVSVVEKPKGKRPMTCAITGQKLISLNDSKSILIEGMSNWDNFKKSLLLTMDDAGKVTQMHPEVSEEIKEEQNVKLNGRVLGYTGEDTTTMLSKEAVEHLLMWFQDKILRGNGKINWIAKKLMPTKDNKSNGSSKNGSKKESFNRNSNSYSGKAHKIVNKPSKTTLGDLSALQQLKKRFEEEGI